jgi:hypothetical protein
VWLENVKEQQPMGEVGESVSFLLIKWRLGSFRLDGKWESSRICVVFSDGK